MYPPLPFCGNMTNMNEMDYEQLVSLLNKLIENKVYGILNNLGIESTSLGKVVALDKTEVDSGGSIAKVVRASVELPDGAVVSNLYNASEETLKIGDNVKIYGSRTNMSNRYIGIKYESEVV